jgi:hypothetical protein
MARMGGQVEYYFSVLRAVQGSRWSRRRMPELNVDKHRLQEPFPQSDTKVPVLSNFNAVGMESESRFIRPERAASAVPLGSNVNRAPSANDSLK